MFTAPKTAGSAAGVGLSPRVVAALHRQAQRQELDRMEWAEAYEDDGLVFCRENGAPLRPEYVLRRFHELSDAAGLPRVRIHDLRHGRSHEGGGLEALTRTHRVRDQRIWTRNPAME